MPDSESKVETIKIHSRRLRGDIGRAIGDDTACVDDETSQVLKFHGTYQQFDRDTATERKKQGLQKEYSFMVRLRIPGGRLTADQYLAIDALCDEVSKGTLRLTTRQDIQLHGVVKGDLRRTIGEINLLCLTTISACGDVVRNITAPAAPIATMARDRLWRDVTEVGRRLLPKTRAYHEIWLDGEKLEGAGEEPEPLYGPTYLPRKFKVGFAVPEDNSVDVLINDVAVIGLFEGDHLLGYNIAIGGSLGMTHNRPDTYPRLATPIIFAEPAALVSAIEAVICMQRDHGDRTNRRHARLKYLVDDRGLDWCRSQIESYAGRSFADPRPMPPFEVPDHLGWHKQGDGRLYLGVFVPTGRLKDEGARRYRSGVRAIIERFRARPILTQSQDLILADIDPIHRDTIDGMLAAHGVAPAGSVLPVRRWSMACPALPTCGLALTEAERIHQPLLNQVEAITKRLGLKDERFSIRVTGCPNGCARSYAGDVGLVGRAPGFYALYLGGDFEGTRLGERVVEKLALDDVPDALERILTVFRDNRRPEEGLGDFCHRLGASRLQEILGDPSSGALAAS